MARIFRPRARKPIAAPQFDGLDMVPSFHPDLVLGVATYALELLRAAPDLDVLYVPIGQGSGICGCILARDLLGLQDRDRRRAIDRSAVLCAVFCGRHGRDHRDQQYAGRRHGDARSRCRCACDHPQGRLAHRAGHRRRGRRRDPRLLDRYAQSCRRRRRRGARRRAAGKGKAPRQARRPDPERRQYRFRSVPAMGRHGYRRDAGQRRRDARRHDRKRTCTRGRQ